MRKVFIDANVIVRYFVKDNVRQLQQAQNLIKDIEQSKVCGLISLLVVHETVWILENYYDLKRNNFIPAFMQLLALKNIKIIEVKKEVVLNVLVRMQMRKIDFTDIYLAEIARHRKIVSFDRDFEKLN